MSNELTEKRPEIVLAALGGKHFLIDGEDHINAMIIWNYSYD